MSMQNHKMSFRYRHRFLVPAVAVSAVGVTACIVRAAVTGVFDMEDSVLVISCLAGISVVCIGRRSAYRWLTFRTFTGGECVCYWLRIFLLCTCALAGFLRTVPLIQIIADIWLVLFSIRLRCLLIDIRCRNPYFGPIRQEKNAYI